ncbi:MAG: hypothetical protein GXO90_05025, partial [FCB group bacterium]|nr:hypothetical protein [FCB group bacterium]
MTAGLFKHWFPGILSLVFLAGNSLPGQSPILDFSEITTAFKTTAKSALTAQAMLQSHHPTLTWDGTHRIAGGLRYTLASRLQSDAVLSGNQQVWVGETSYLITTNLGISGQLGWIRDGTDVAYMQG